MNLINKPNKSNFFHSAKFNLAKYRCELFSSKQAFKYEINEKFEEPNNIAKLNFAFVIFYFICYGILFLTNSILFGDFLSIFFGGITLIIMLSKSLMIFLKKNLIKKKYAYLLMISITLVTLCLYFLFNRLAINKRFNTDQLKTENFTFSIRESFSFSFLAFMFFSYFSNFFGCAVFIMNILCNTLFIVILSIHGIYVWETVSIVIITIYFSFSEFKKELIQKKFLEEIESLRKNIKVNDFLYDKCNLGYCIIDNNFRLLDSNLIFKQNFSHLILRKKVEKTKKEKDKKIQKDIINFSNSASINWLITNDFNGIFQELEDFDLNLQADNLFQIKESNNCVDKNEENNLINEKMHINENSNCNCLEDKLTLKSVLENRIRISDQLGYENFRDSQFKKLNKFYINRESNYKEDNIYEVYFRRNFVEKNTLEIIFLNIKKCRITEKLNGEKKYQSNLIAKISHEFKAPTMYIQNIIENFLDNKFALNYYDNSLNKSVIQAFKQIKYLTEIIILLVFDLSEYSNITQESIELNVKRSNSSNFEIFAIREFVENLANSMMLIYDKKLELTITVEEELELAKITVDEKKLKQIIFNLLSNAIRLTIEGKISIHIGSMKRKEIKQEKTNIKKLDGDTHNLCSEFYKRISFSNENKNSELITNKPITQIAQINRNHTECTFECDSEEIKNSNQGLIITIEDSGPGLDSSIVEMINENFKQSFLIENKIIDKQNTQTFPEFDYSNSKGMGFGLKICKKLCKEIGFEMKCEVINNNLRKLSEEMMMMMKNDSNLMVQATGTKISLIYKGLIDRPIIDSCRNTIIAQNFPFKLTQLDKMHLDHDSYLDFSKNEKSPTDLQHKEDEKKYGRKKKIRNFRNLKLEKPINLEINHQNISQISKYTKVKSSLYLNNKNDRVNISSFMSHKNENLSRKKIIDLRNKQVKCREELPESENEDTMIINENINIFQAHPDFGVYKNFLAKDDGKIIPIKNLSERNVNKKYSLHSNNTINIVRLTPQNQIRRLNLDPINISNLNKINIQKNLASYNLSNYLRNSEKSPNPKNTSNYCFTDITNHSKNASEFPNKNDPEKLNFVTSSLNKEKKIPVSRNFKHSKTSLKSLISKNFNESSSDEEELNQENLLNRPRFIKILVVDDNKNNQEAICRLVNRYYYKYNQKHSKKKELNLIKLNDGIELIYEIYTEINLKGRPLTRIIFCDEMMNYMNGSEAFVLLNNLLRDKKLKKVPFVICSSFNQEEHFKKMKSLSIEHVYEKPLSYGNIEFILNSLLN